MANEPRIDYQLRSVEAPLVKVVEVGGEASGLVLIGFRPATENSGPDFAVFIDRESAERLMQSLPEILSVIDKRLASTN